MIRNIWMGAKMATTLVAGAALVLLVGGCGAGSNSSGVVYVKTTDAVANGGNATIELNSGSVSGAQNFFSSTNYHYMQPCNATLTFTFNTSSTTYPATSAIMYSGKAYDFVVVGDYYDFDPTSTNYPKGVLLTDDQYGTTSDKVLVRFVAAAPDVAQATIAVNGTQAAAGLTIGTPTGYVAYTGVAPTVAVTDGNGNTVLAANQVNLNGGHSYTIFLDEPSTGSYRLDVVQDH